MQIVIDIDDKVYGLLKYFEEGLGLNDKKDDNDDVKTALIRAAINGIPLPKGHGDLIDIKDLRQDIIAHKYSNTFCEVHHIDQSINVGMVNILLADAPIIIEADRESEE